MNLWQTHRADEIDLSEGYVGIRVKITKLYHNLWGCSSIGRALALQARGSGIVTHQLHQSAKLKAKLSVIGLIGAIKKRIKVNSKALTRISHLNYHRRLSRTKVPRPDMWLSGKRYIKEAK